MAHPWRIDTTDVLTAGRNLSGSANAMSQTVLIVTDALEGVSDIGEMLIGIGYRVQVAMTIEMADECVVRGMPHDRPDALMVCLTDMLPRAASLLGALKAHLQDPLIPVIGYLAPSEDSAEGFDSILVRPAHANQVAGRVDAMVRLQAMQHEIMRRTQVLRNGFGINHRLTADALNRPLRVLFIGKAKPDFMVVLNALRARKAEVVAAFTSFTAFDYLHGREFDAVIIDAISSTEPAHSILSAMSRNIRMMHVPKVVLAGDKALDPVLEAFATDVITSEDPTEELTGRILEPANYHRIHSQLRAEFDGLGDERTRDADTGLWNADYFRSYTNFLASEGEHRTVCTLRMTPDADGPIDEPFIRLAYAQAGGMIAGLVRINDLTARISYDSFAIAVPPMRADHLAGLCERVSGVIECAAFEPGKTGKGPFTLKVQVTVDSADDIARVA